MANNKNKTSVTTESLPEPTTAPPLPGGAASSAANDPKTKPGAPTDDTETDKAIDDITEHESDEVLKAEDAELAKAFEPKAAPHGLKARLKAFIQTCWNNKKIRYSILAGLVILLVVVVGIPQSRYFILNNTGVRSSASLTIVDNSTQQPLKNVEVQLANQTGKTDNKGIVKLTHLKLGMTQLTIDRRAFASVTKKVTVGWGTNPLGNFNLTPTGSQYTFLIRDFLSGKPVAKAEATATDANNADAIADDKGQLVLTIDPNDSTNLTVTIKADNYRDVVTPLNLDDKNTHTVTMVPAQKHAFVSKRSGKYDLYAIDVDGANEKVILAGTGTERDDISVVPHPVANIVALVSTRDNVRNKDGFLLSNLNILDTKTGQRTPVSQSEKIQVIDWIGNRLIFVQVAAGASANDSRRQRLVSYDYTSNTQKELASSNNFFDLVSAGGNIYYSTSDVTPSGQAAFYKINPEGTSRLTLLSKEVWNIFRTQYDHLTLAVGSEWYDYKIGDVTTNKLTEPPVSQANRVYQDNSDRKKSLWTDSRDGKGVLLEYDVVAQKDSTLRSQSGLNSPIYWLNDHYVVYRIHTEQETADYVLNLDGGQPRKISDVTNTSGLGQWYYYQ